MYKNIFAFRIKQAREEAKITQEQVSIKLNVTRSNVTKYENGYLEPNIDTICVFAKLYNTSVDYLLGLTDDKRKYW